MVEINQKVLKILSTYYLHFKILNGEFIELTLKNYLSFFGVYTHFI